MEMSVPCLVTVSLQSYKNQIGTNVPDLSNSPGKLTDPFLLQQKGPAKPKGLIISYQGINPPALHSDGTRDLQSPGSARAEEEELELLPLSLSEEPTWGERMADASESFQAFFLLLCDLLIVQNEPSHKTDLLFSFLAVSPSFPWDSAAPAHSHCSRGSLKAAGQK